jgi:hypothetical protein
MIPSLSLKHLPCRLLLGLLAASVVSRAADPAYREVAQGRASKIVAGMDTVAGTDRAETVIGIIADQYCDLHDLHQSRDAALAALKEAPEVTAEFAAAARAALERESENAVLRLQITFLARLSAHLDADEIDAVKDGLTYGRMPRDYGVYLEMLPDLSAEQKARIYAWMWEARERAMSGGSSNEKHGWFGKYKGRINNYLSAAGYDLKEAERLLYQRRKEAASR